MESQSPCVRIRRNPLIHNHNPHVTQITIARENYHCHFPVEADNEERHYLQVVPTEVGL